MDIPPQGRRRSPLQSSWHLAVKRRLMKRYSIFLPWTVILFILSGCATSRDMTSSHYLPEWENRIFNFPNPSETSGGYWAAKTAHKTGQAIGKAMLFPFAILGNVAYNAYLVPTWPFRWLLRGDKRLLVWIPIFHAGEETGSDYFSKQWNHDLT